MHRPALQRFTEPVILLFLAGICYVLFFHGLSGIGLLGPDEPRYAAVAREMYRSGDYVTPRLHGEPWFEKPVLMYWTAALSFALFGVGEFGARFPSAFGAALSVFFVYRVSLRLWGRATAIWASLILASSVGYFAFGRAASMDMPLTVCLTAALLAFLMACKAAEPERRRWFYAFYAFVGLGVLAKGPVAVVLPALSLLCYLLFRGRRGEWKEWHPRAAWIVAAVAAPWYAAVFWANGWEFVRVFIIDQNLARFTSTVHGHQRPFYFYIPDLLMLTFPWTFLLIPAFRRTLERTDRILIWWAVVPVLFFSFAGSKLPGYILPSVPPIAMLCARAVSDSSSRPFRVAAFIEAGVMLFIGIAFGFFGDMLNIDAHVNGRIITGATFTLAALLAAIALWMRPVVLAAFNVTAIVLAVLVTASFILPRFETTDTMRPWQRELDELIPPNEVVYLYRPSRWMEYGLEYYRFNRIQGVYSPEELSALLEEGSQLLFIADDRGLMDVAEISGLEVQIVRTVGNQSAFLAWEAE